MSGLTAAAARKVRLLGLDVDGVLTDNGVYIGPIAGDRVELKRFDIQDGLGLILLKTAGMPVVWVSGRASEATALRAAELRVEELLQVPGPRKAAAFEQVLQRLGIGWHEVAFVGDDLADLPILRRVGLPIAVANAVPEVKEISAVYHQRSGRPWRRTRGDRSIASGPRRMARHSGALLQGAGRRCRLRNRT